MKISKYLYGFIILAILLGGVGIAKTTDVWHVSAKVNLDGSSVELSGTDVEEIKGWMSIDEIITGFNLDKDQLYQYLNFPENLSTSTLIKDIKGLTGIDPEPIKDFIIEQQQ